MTGETLIPTNRERLGLLPTPPPGRVLLRRSQGGRDARGGHCAKQSQFRKGGTNVKSFPERESRGIPCPLGAAKQSQFPGEIASVIPDPVESRCAWLPARTRTNAGASCETKPICGRQDQCEVFCSKRVTRDSLLSWTRQNKANSRAESAAAVPIQRRAGALRSRYGLEWAKGALCKTKPISQRRHKREVFCRKPVTRDSLLSWARQTKPILQRDCLRHPQSSGEQVRFAPGTDWDGQGGIMQNKANFARAGGMDANCSACQGSSRYCYQESQYVCCRRMIALYMRKGCDDEILSDPTVCRAHGVGCG
jgi:hypothetical protein